jgi:hypothetical protein
MLVLLVIGLSGCTCFVPVDDRPDGGGDAGGGQGGAGGGTADAGLECLVALDCPWVRPDAGIPFTNCPNSEGMSCVDGRCIFECDSGRACTTDAGTHCLDCTKPVEKTECGPVSCSAIYSCQMQVFVSSCAQGPKVGDRFVATRQADCGWVLSLPDGGPVVGAMWDLDVGRSFATFPGVRGTCAGRDLFTGVPRMSFSCPDGCTFAEMGCD